MPDQDDEAMMSPKAALEEIADCTGQGYYYPDFAQRVLDPFNEHVTDEFAAEYDTVEYPTLSLSKAIEARQTTNKRGIVAVPAWQPVVTGADISGILVRAVGLEESDYHAGGAGFTSDGRHRENVETLYDHFEWAERDDDD